MPPPPATRHTQTDHWEEEAITKKSVQHLPIPLDLLVCHYCFSIMYQTLHHVKLQIFCFVYTGNQLNRMYESYTLFHLHICQVCGSFQCPYCPFYNAAPPATSLNVYFLCALSLLTLVLGQLQTKWRILQL